MAVALVIVSHSVKLAEGVVELASQMARDVAFRAAGSTEDGDLGTSFDKVYGAVEELLADGHEVAILTDLGSATMTVESVLEMVDPDRVRFAPGPLVEGRSRRPSPPRWAAAWLPSSRRPRPLTRSRGERLTRPRRRSSRVG